MGRTGDAMGGSGELDGQVLLDGRWVGATVAWNGGRVSTIERTGRVDGPMVMPGFVDLHCHGGGGADTMEGGDAVHRIARLHAAHGTAALLATTMTAPLDEVEEALRSVAIAMRRQGTDEAKLLGVHLEGPFISPDQLGAQPPHAIPATVAVLERLCTLAPIRVVTMAPEADPTGDCAAWLRTRGVRVQIGHTAADFETASNFIRANSGVTHLFNAMGGFHHRRPGTTAAALTHAVHAEIIADLQHAEPGAVLMALRAIPELYAVTDVTAASGMPDGLYKLGRYDVCRAGAPGRLASGGRAGSCLTMDEAFRNLASRGLSPEEASRRTSTIPADYVGAKGYGRIAVGAPACLVSVDLDGSLLGVVQNGRPL